MHEMALNEVPIETIKTEVGIEGWKTIEQLTLFLFADKLPAQGPDPNWWKKAIKVVSTGRWPARRINNGWIKKIPKLGRLAPSVMSRIEVGVFGTSMPRFCYRLYFEGAQGFINVRRLKTLQKSLGETPSLWWVERDLTLREEEKHPHILGEIKEKTPTLMHDEWEQYVIADCLVSPPPRFSEKNYHVIKAKLFKEHGEILERVGQPSGARGTPFVKTVVFGGGLCAQACCLVATMLLYEYAEAIYGLSEITALASSPRLKELLIAGLTEHEMVTYFRNVGCGAVPQFTNPSANVLLLKRNQDTDFGQALHGYVASGMPVILLVDIARLNGEGVAGTSIYESNYFGLDSVPQYRYHAITVAGCSRWEDSGTRNFMPPTPADGSFLLLDSASLPFVRASVEQLAQTGSWEFDHVPIELRHPIFIPATPKRVKMPLLCWRKSGTGKNWDYGLIEISKRHTRFPIDPNVREFILSPLNKLPIFRICRHFGVDHRNDVATILHETLRVEAKERLGLAEDCWVWLECGSNLVKVWDAEVGLDEKSTPETLLLAVVQLDDTKPAVRFFIPNEIVIRSSPDLSARPSARAFPVILAERAKTNPLVHPKNYPLVASVISSFSALGMNRAVEFWDSSTSSTLFVEAYICMQNDLTHFFECLRDKRAVEILAEKAEVAGADRDFAIELKRIFAGKTIGAFATFMPEIMAPHKVAYTQAQQALKFLVKVARHLRTPERPFTIELVGGSRLQGIWKAKTSDGEPALAVNRLDTRTAISTLLERLEPVAACANQDSGIQLALESEPGPLFVFDPFGDAGAEKPSQLFEMCRLIETSKNANIRQVLGINLDVAHWAFLSKISLEWLKKPENRVIRDRIVHAHISDHGKGHFCDNAIGTCHSLEEFRGWIEFLADLSKDVRAPDCPRFSGIISCEMEACKSSSFVKASLEKLDELLSGSFSV